MAVSQAFSDWCAASGIAPNGIQAGFVAHGWRGIVAMTSIHPGTVVLEVPERLLMSRRSAEADPVLRRVLQAHPGLQPEQVLMSSCTCRSS